ncbi:MAG: hypothetical protein N2578_00895 [Bdellovibrionaceae bacterium]|nr:hypothetical protein [Pseudobdellovibrionaceae bacterium]
MMENFETESILNEMENSQFPRALIEQLGRGSGLLIVAGQRRAEVTNVVGELITYRINRGFARSCSRNLFESLAEETDFVVHSGVIDRSVLERSLLLAEGGGFVILNPSAPDVMTVLHQIGCLISGREAESLWWRLSMCLLSVSARMLIGNRAEAWEILLNTPEVRALLRNGDLLRVEELLYETKEGDGKVSFNQSLLGLLIRRKITLNQAFLASPQPERLDELMKKVGI